MPKQVHNALSPKRVKSETKPGRYADGNGLYLHVSDTGARWWLWRGSLHGKRIERGVGSATLITLAEARDIAWQWRRWAKGGIDPAEERDRDKMKSITFEEAARQVWRDQIETTARNPKSKRQWLTTLEAHVIPLIGARPVHTISEDDILRVLSPIWIDRAVTARRIRQRLRVIMDWARVAKLYSGINPVLGVGEALSKKRPKVQHFAALPYSGLPDLMYRLASDEHMAALALRFMILTAARSGEVRGATWPEIDRAGRVWVIPPERMKAEREHRVPLSDAALAVLDRVRGLSEVLVFPSSRMKRPMSDSTLGTALRAHVSRVTCHGMRSTFRDWTEEMTGFPREVKEAALAHTVRDKVEAAYRRSDLFDKRRQLMDQWGRFCLSAGSEGDAVEIRA